MRVRPIADGEHEQAGDLTVAAYAALPGAHLTGGYEEELRAVARRAVEALVLVAEADGGRIVGAVTYVGHHTSPWGASEGMRAGEAFIRMLAVDPAVQGSGAGGALVDACIEQARTDGKRAVVLHTTPWMTVAQRIYERRGFRPLPDRDYQPLPEVPLIAYGLELAAR